MAQKPNTLKQQNLDAIRYWKQFEKWMPTGYRLVSNRMMMTATYRNEHGGTIELTEDHVAVIYSAMQDAARA